MKYIDVYNEIKRRIINGHYAAWSPLEGEYALSHAFNVSRPTLRKAIDKLKQESFLYTRQGAGIFVNPPEFYKDNKLASISERIDRDSKLKNIILGFNIIEADTDMVKKFKLTENKQMIHYNRVRVINDKPMILENTWMPKYLFPDFEEKHCYGSVLHFIENDAGLNISHDAEIISGKLLNEHEAFLFQAQKGQLCLSVEHNVYLLHSILAQYTIETLISNKLTRVSLR